MATNSSTSYSSSNNLMTVSELIETTFGDPETNVVHHKQLQTVLHLLARQLRILERHVAIPKKHGKFGKQRSSSSLSVTEVKLQAMPKKHKKEAKSLERKENVTSGETTPSDKTDRRAKSGKKASSTTDVRTMSPQEYQKLLDEVEQTRERELRVIRQRPNSREQREKTPTPIASMDSVEATYEKLLVVERVPAEEAAARAARERAGGQKDDLKFRLPVVTQEEFEALSATVRELQKKFDPIGKAEFPENAQLMQELRKGASLTNAMAALQLSARLEATEKTLKNLLSLVTTLAQQTSGIDLVKQADDIQVILDAPVGKRRPSITDGKSTEVLNNRSQLTSQSKKDFDRDPGSVSKVYDTMSITEKVEEDIGDRLTYDKLQTTLEEFYRNVIETVNGMTTKSITSAENALKIASKLEGKLIASLNIGSRMDNLESLTNSNAQQINILDISISSQMANYQEELTKMQNDLEVGLETMTEVLANAGGDATAVAELNAHFNVLQADIDNSLVRQKELSDTQYSLSMDLESLRIQIELLRETKSDREEVVDALRDKAGLAALNGLVTQEQLDCVLGDIEKRIKAAYDTFNKQELVWQKAIDDFVWNLNEKADLVQVESLRDEICRYLRDFKAKLNFISEIVGEPEAAALSKRINRDGACLSCATPAHMKIEEATMPKLPALRPPAMGAEAPAPSEDGDHGVCYPGYPISHPTDPRSYVCRRWCGGSHTVQLGKTIRPPSCLIITAQRKSSQEQNVGKKIEKPMPCSLCNPEPTPAMSDQYNDPSISDEVSSYDFRPVEQKAYNTITPEIILTPPADFEIE